MAEVGSLFVRLRADASEFEEALSGIGSEFKNKGKGIQSAGASMSKSVTAPLVGIAGAAIAVGSGFDYQMARVQAISGATDSEFQDLRDTALELGSSTKYTATQAAEGLEYMALAGWDANQSTAALPGVLALAAAGNMELGRTSDIVTDTMSAFGVEAKDAISVADMFAAAQSKSNTNVEQLGEAFKYAGPQAAAAGMDIAETSAALGVLADSGLKGSMAGTTLNGMLRDLMSNVEDGKVNFGDFAVEIFDAEGNMRDFGDIMRDVENGTAGMNDAQRESALRSIFQAQSLRGVNVMLATGMDRYDELNESIRDSNGLAQQQASIMSDTVRGGFTAMSSAMEGVLIQLSDVLTPLLMEHVIPALQGLIGTVSRVVEWFSNLNPTIQTVIIVIAGILAAIGPLLVVFGTLGIMIGGAITAFATFAPILAAILSPIGLIVIAIAALVVGLVVLYKKSETFRNIVNGAFNAVWKVISGVVGLVVDLFRRDWAGAWQRISGWVTSAKDAIAKALPGIWNAIKGFITETLPKIGGQLAEWAGAFVGWVGPQIPVLLEKLGELLLKLGEWMASDAVPTITRKLVEWGLAFVEWVGPHIPPLLEELGNLLSSLAGWLINTALPGIAGKLAEWGKAFATWVGPAIVDLLVELGKLLADVGKWIISEALPKITTKLVEWGGAFFGWVGPAIVDLLVELGKLYVKVANWITFTALPKIITKLAEWAGAFVGWVADAVTDLPGKLLSVITTIEQWATDNLSKAGDILKDIGKALIDGLIKGITGKFTDLKNKLGEVTDLIPDWKGPLSKDRTLLQPTGLVIMEGLETGISRGAAGVERRLQRLTSDLGGVTLNGGAAGMAGAGGARVLQPVKLYVGEREFGEAVIEINNDHGRKTWG